MIDKRLIWIGAFVGSTLGGMVPRLWHASVWSMWGILFSMIGGLAGIWAGWKMAQR